MPHPLFSKYYPEGHPARDILVLHSQMVREKALWVAQQHPELNADTDFIAEASLLHDIGIFLTDAPTIGCHGTYPYICHGFLGRELLEKEGMPRHALICERHTGIGLTREEIIRQQLPLPHREMLPLSIEEQIICFTDTFFSKGKNPGREIPSETIRKKLMKFGPEKVVQFDRWSEQFL